MKNRNISNNIRLVLDLIDYSDLTDEESFILFLDYYKALIALSTNLFSLPLKHLDLGLTSANVLKHYILNKQTALLNCAMVLLID